MKRTKKYVCMMLTLILTISTALGTTAIPAMAKGTTVSVKASAKKTTKTFTVKQYKYRVLTQTAKKGTVSLIGTTSKNVKTVTIPSYVKKNGRTYTVVAIGDSAFKNCKKLTTVTTNRQITKIGKYAFWGCSRLKKITVKATNLKQVGAYALKGIYKKAVISVPANKKNTYVKILKKKGQAATVKVSAPATAKKVTAVKQTAATKQTEKQQVQTEQPKAETKQIEPQVQVPFVPQQSAPVVEAPTAEPQTAEPKAEPQAQSAPAAAPAEEPKAEPQAQSAPAAAPAEEPKTEPQVQSAPQQSAPAAAPAEEPKAEPQAQSAPQQSAPTAEPEAEPQVQSAPQQGAPAAEPEAEPQAQSAPQQSAPAAEPEAEPQAQSASQQSAPAAEPKNDEPQNSVPSVTPEADPKNEEKQEDDLPWEDIEPGHVYATVEEAKAAYGPDWKSHTGKHKTVQIEDVKANCTAAGKTDYRICTLCGQEFFKLNGEPTGNDHVWKLETTAATCTAAGKTTATCTVCGVSQETVLKALGHQWGEPVIHQPTCTEDGYTEHTCTVCETTETYNNVPSLGHQFKKTTGEDGKPILKCVREGCSEIMEQSVAQPQEGKDQDNLLRVDVEPDPSLLTEGDLPTAEAVKDKYKASWEPHAGQHVTVHVADVARTCEEWGKKCYHICILCGQEFFDLQGMKPLGHTWAEQSAVDVEATCTKTGSQSIHCTRCGATEPGTETAIEKKDHQWGEAVLHKGDCEHDGWTERTCTVCGEKEVTSIERRGHKFITVEESATCTKAGATVVKCERCGYERSRVVTGEALGHDYNGDWITDVAATCGAEGHQYKQCSRCDAKMEQAVPATGEHKLDGNKETVASTCTTSGYVKQYCSECGRNVIIEILPRTEHQFDGGDRCTVCHKRQDEIEKDADSGHIWYITYLAGDGCKGIQDERGNVSGRYAASRRGNVGVIVTALPADESWTFKGWQIVDADGNVLEELLGDIEDTQKTNATRHDTYREIERILKEIQKTHKDAYQIYVKAVFEQN